MAKKFMVTERRNGSGRLVSKSAGEVYTEEEFEDDVFADYVNFSGDFDLEKNDWDKDIEKIWQQIINHPVGTMFYLDGEEYEVIEE